MHGQGPGDPGKRAHTHPSTAGGSHTDVVHNGMKEVSMYSQADLSHRAQGKKRYKDESLEDSMCESESSQDGTVIQEWHICQEE